MDTAITSTIANFINNWTDAFLGRRVSAIPPNSKGEVVILRDVITVTYDNPFDLRTGRQVVRTFADLTVPNTPGLIAELEAEGVMIYDV